VALLTPRYSPSTTTVSGASNQWETIASQESHSTRKAPKTTFRTYPNQYGCLPRESLILDPDNFGVKDLKDCLAITSCKGLIKLLHNFEISFGSFINFPFPFKRLKGDTEPDNYFDAIKTDNPESPPARRI